MNAFQLLSNALPTASNACFLLTPHTPQRERSNAFQRHFGAALEGASFAGWTRVKGLDDMRSRGPAGNRPTLEFSRAEKHSNSAGNPRDFYPKEDVALNLKEKRQRSRAERLPGTGWCPASPQAQAQ